MAKLTIGFGIALIALGVLGYVDTGSTHPTALIPTWAGLLFVLLGALSNTADSKRRMLWMHTAVTLALLGFLGSGSRAISEYIGAHGAPLAHPVAVEDQAAMAMMCLVYVLLCVRSFIAARKARSAVVEG